MSESQKVLSPHEIERWVPPSLRHVVGCSKLNEHFANMLRVDGLGPNTLVTGETGTGKSAIVKAYIQTLACPHRDLATLDKCGNCEACMGFEVRYASTGLYAYLFRGFEDEVLVHYLPVDCSSVTQADLQPVLLDMREWQGKTLVFLDDVHLLQERGLEGVLLKALEAVDTMWIATAPSANMLSKPFLRRFAAVLSTSPASQEEFVAFLGERCKEWGLNVDTPETLVLLAQRCKLIPAYAIRALAVIALAIAAGKKDQTLSQRLVLEQHFPDEDDGHSASPGAGFSKPSE